MGLLGWFFDWAKGTDHRPPQRVRMKAVKKVKSQPPRSRAWVKNTSPIPDEPFFEAMGPAVKCHFELIDQIEAAWKSKNRRDIVILCEAQIALSGEVLAALWEEDRLNEREPYPVSHTGFNRLAMLHEREKNYQQAIRVCEDAIAAGWAEYEFSHRAARCRLKLAKG